MQTCYDKVSPYRDVVVLIYVDFSGGCTGAAEQVPHCVTRAWSLASGSFPSPRGAPHWDLLIKLHMCQITSNPSESSISASQRVVAVVTAGNKLWQTHNIAERERWKLLTLFVSHTVRYDHTNGQIAWKCVSVTDAKMVLSLFLFFFPSGRVWLMVEELLEQHELKPE